MTDLTGKRVLILGAETDIGRAVTTAVAEAGASVAAVAATSDAEAAFAVQRLARRLASDERKVIAQAIDATNETAVRVMVRQVSKELGGLDAAVSAADLDLSERSKRFLTFLTERATKEIRDRDGAAVIAILPTEEPLMAPSGGRPSGEVILRPESVTTWLRSGSDVVIVHSKNRASEEVVTETLAYIASPPVRR